MRTHRKIAAGLGIGLVAATSLMSTAPANADVPVMTLYKHINFTGAEYPEGGPHMCNDSLGDTEYFLNKFPDFNDTASSFRGWSNCWVRLYEHINYGGAIYGYLPGSSSLGGFNDLASSLKAT